MTERASQPTYDARLLHDQRVPTRDGIELSADVYLPLAGGSFPTIVQWTPYESTRERFIAWGVYFARRGYAAVVVDIRGRYESGGVLDPWVFDGVDAQDTLTWAVGEPWSDGRDRHLGAQLRRGRPVAARAPRASEPRVHRAARDPR